MKQLTTLLRDALGRLNPVADPEAHLSEAMAWLCRAQDATGSGGVARSYSLRRKPSLGQGWLPAYPETTGYIIPTFLKYAKLTGNADYRERAIRMARWESEVQMPSGAVQGGVIGYAPTPAIFNTGQVLFGWAAAYQECGDAAFLESARRASDFLVEAQDPDGVWRRGASKYARTGVNVYDARTAWGLVEAWRVTQDQRHLAAGLRNLDFALTRQQPNGWFSDCCLDDDRRPLLHTLAYTMEGLLEAGLILGRKDYVAAAARIADALVSLQRPDGSLAGRFDAQWRPAVKWSCLTGDAQTAICWWRLFGHTGDERYREAATRMNRFLAATQDRGSADPGVRGGIKGAHPIWGDYGAYEYLNWAAKFYADALMLELDARRRPDLAAEGATARIPATAD